MLTKLLATAATATVLAIGLTVPAEASPSVAPAAAYCHAHKATGHSYWVCVTPGSYCPQAAHYHYGYAKPNYSHRLYRCLRYSNGRWRWKRA